MSAQRSSSPIQNQTQNPRKILLVEDDANLGEAIRAQIDQSGFKATHVLSSKKAKELLSVEAFDLVLSDIHMPESPSSGIELLHFVKKNLGIPVILMTGFAELAETKEAFELGAAGFLAKPFRPSELFDLFNQILGKEEKKLSPEEIDAGFAKLSIDEFISGRQIKHSIYVKLAPGRYIKIAFQGEDLEAGRVQNLKEKKITHLYLTQEDFRIYLGFSVNLTQLAGTATGIDPIKKLALLKHTGEILLESIRHDGVREDDLGFAKSVVETTVNLLSNSAPALELLTILKNHTDFLYTHSLGVCFFANLIARESRWAAQSTLAKLSIAALMHDIGKKEFEPEFLKKPRFQYNHADTKIYETHPQRGVEALGKIQEIPSEVLQTILQHHERCNGGGFPVGLRRDRINPMAKIIAVADEFCKLVLPTPGSPGLPPTDALNHLQSLFSDALEPDYLVALFNIFGVPMAPKASKNQRH